MGKSFCPNREIEFLLRYIITYCKWPDYISEFDTEGSSSNIYLHNIKYFLYSTQDNLAFPCELLSRRQLVLIELWDYQYPWVVELYTYSRRVHSVLVWVHTNALHAYMYHEYCRGHHRKSSWLTTLSYRKWGKIRWAKLSRFSRFWRGPRKFFREYFTWAPL